MGGRRVAGRSAGCGTARGLPHALPQLLLPGLARRGSCCQMPVPRQPPCRPGSLQGRRRRRRRQRLAAAAAGVQGWGWALQGRARNAPATTISTPRRCGNACGRRPIPLLAGARLCAARALLHENIDRCCAHRRLPALPWCCPCMAETGWQPCSLWPLPGAIDRRSGTPTFAWQPAWSHRHSSGKTPVATRLRRGAGTPRMPA